MACPSALQERTLVDELVAFNCDPNTEYNEVASLFLRDADTAIRQVRASRQTTIFSRWF